MQCTRATVLVAFATVPVVDAACFTPDLVSDGFEGASTTALDDTFFDAGTTSMSSEQSTTKNHHESTQAPSDSCTDGTGKESSCSEPSLTGSSAATSSSDDTNNDDNDEQSTSGIDSITEVSNSSGVTDECSNDEKICNETCIPESNCCESNECQPGHDCVNGSCEDITAPRILSFFPHPGATGVASDAEISVTFSEPMDPASVESAFSISPVSADSDELLFQWDEDGVTLTVRGANFSYGTGDSPESTARRYIVTIGRQASDLNGNSLDAAVATEFATLRRISQTALPIAVASWDSFGRSWNTCTGTATEARVGWWVNAGSSGRRYVYVAYDPQVFGTQALLHEIERAVLRTSQSAPTGDYYEGGRVYLEHMSPLQFIDGISNETPLSTVGTLTSSYVTNPSIDATGPWLDAWRDDASLIVFRLSEHTQNASSSLEHTAAQGTYANFTCDGFSIDVTYLRP